MSEVLDAYPHGPGAPAIARSRALAKLDGAEAVIVVEGVSDQIAVETLATLRGRDLAAEAIVVVPIGGAQAVGRFLRRVGPRGADLDLAGLCDLDGVDAYCAGAAAAGLGEPRSVADLASIGFHVCIDDLEDELIRAAGPATVEAVLAEQGELGAFRTMQKQPAWRGAPVEAQLRRFLQAKARRSLRYARLLIDAVDPDQAPAPLVATLRSLA